MWRKFWKKQLHRNWRQDCRGVISIFLCLILSPMLMLASALVEYERYQANAQMVQEVLDCAAYSTLADYDSYLKDRFGLFALEQNLNVKDSYLKNLDGCSGVLSNMVTVPLTHSEGNDYYNDVQGQDPLTNRELLKRQILDFSESTVMSEFLLDGLNLQELLDKLNNLKGLEKVAEAAEQVKTAAENVEKLVDCASELAEELRGLLDVIEDIGTQGAQLKEAITNVLQQMSEDGYTVSSLDDDSLKSIIEKYLDGESEDEGDATIYDIYDSACVIWKDIDTLSDKFEAVQNCIKKTQQALEQAKSSVAGAEGSTGANAPAMEETKSETKDSTLAVSAAATNNVLSEIIDSLDNAVSKAADTLKEETISAVKEAANTLKEELRSGFKVDEFWDAGAFSADKEKVKEYFSLPLSDSAKKDLEDFIALIPGTVNGDTSALEQKITDTFFPHININFGIFDDLKGNTGNIVSKAVSEAEKKLKEKVSNSLKNTLSALKDALDNLFDLDVFYNADLNAALSDETLETLPYSQSEDNPYVTLLRAIRKMTSSVDDFVEGAKHLKILSVVGAFVKLMEAAVTALRAVVQLAGKVIQKITELVSYAANGSFDSLYDLLLISSYLSYDLPNRTNSNGGNLSGKALTGYQYSNITVSATGSETGIPGIDGLISLLSEDTENRKDTMFKGAELEYILAGTDSEYMNQIVTFLDLYILRLLMDVSVVFTDPAVAEMAAAASIAAWAVYVIVLLGEPLCDTVFLVNGEDSYLIKNGCYLTPNGLPKLINKLSNLAIGDKGVRNAVVGNLNQKVKDKLPASSNSFQEGGIFEMDYKDHMLVVLMMSKTESDMLERFANLIQLEAASHYSTEGKSFQVKQSYTAIRASIFVEYNSFLDRLFEITDRTGFRKQYVKYRGY